VSKWEIIKKEHSNWGIKLAVSLCIIIILGWLVMLSRIPRLVHAASFNINNAPKSVDAQNRYQIRFAVIGDYGTGTSHEAVVAELVA
jgi:hypothetical protein